MNIKVKYLDPNLPKLEKIDKGDLVDLRASKVFINGQEQSLPCTYEANDIVFIKLGFAARLPLGYKACIYPRSSTFKNYGLILTNSVGQIDNSYSGNGDEWGAMFISLRPGTINHGDRVAQFDIQRTTMDNIGFEVVEDLGNNNRGGYGSTGTN